MQIRDAGLAAEMDYLNRSLRAQMRHADRLGTPVVVVLGEEELARGVAAIRLMDSGEQREVSLDRLMEEIVAVRSS